MPTPGADRLAVTSHIGMLDLMALGDVLLNRADDLQLAALLRSPLFDLSEEDLFALAAAARRSDEPLWEALRDSDLMPARTAYNELSAGATGSISTGRSSSTPTCSTPSGGLKRFHARFGNEVDDVFAEFLDLALEHEQSEQPSLQGFLAAHALARRLDQARAREAGGGVRVMTVHGAKGLEAPIVILADAASKPSGLADCARRLHRRRAATSSSTPRARTTHVDETDGVSRGATKRRRRPSTGASSMSR